MFAEECRDEPGWSELLVYANAPDGTPIYRDQSEPNRKLKCEPCELSIDGSSYEEADGSTVTPAPATDVNSCGLSDRSIQLLSSYCPSGTNES